MYKSFKNIAKKIIPKSLFEKNKVLLRKVASLPYRGSKFQCNVCDVKLRKFVPVSEDDKLCPNCGSRSRTRQLYQLIQELPDVKDFRTLHFSPSLIFSEKLRAQIDNYITSDFVNEFESDVQYDITAIPEKENCFDLIICFHILEHIMDDEKAIAELYRILKPNGICFIQTPFKEGDIYENESITSPEDRLKHFGQEDHVRIYSITGLQSRLEKYGFKTEKLSFSYDEFNTFGFSSSSYIIKATK